MKASEIKEHIVITKREVGDERTMFSASITITRHMPIPTKELKLDPFVEKQIRERLMEELILDIYDDQRQELYRSLMDLYSTHPFDFDRMNEARGRLLEAAMRQQPQ